MGMGMGIGDGKWEWEIESTPSPRRWQYNAWGHPPQPPTFNNEGGLWQQSAFSKYVLGWSPKPIQQKNYQVDSDNNNLGESTMIQEKVINNP